MQEHEVIYQSETETYDRLIANEDREGNVLRAIRTIVPNLAQVDAADIGSGTGKIARRLASQVKSIVMTDASKAMLAVAEKHLKAGGSANWRMEQGMNENLPLADHAVDLLTAGWTICYSTSSNIPNWEDNLQRIQQEIARVVKPGGSAVIFENFGTGSSVPDPPDFLTAYYAKLELQYGFAHTVIQTDFEFESVEEAAALTDFFFGSELSQEVLRTQVTRVPGFTGVWWKRY
ncbi:class I SAM-dependent methyltransferase [Paenibacillus rhizovicinus]|uniref:Class I SAM-dependent methyltransferase n=1 Tax=Paenibacillus rhizovicinus TaxID=2704463 RepID=A0A6C0PC99_9BACL|nr:class I SAM-dependent methyltransferase [Paenibacillus rhizovicinus]QHW34392.1 class I SAM-dependent methyltransferase [Paenibacillus rhizovicinus]